ncbi:MAG: phosphate ABC transporter permease subunit PstC [Bdellovibrionota bacterium]|nr:phosphate ABC transporter permease subunit PstC [Bdellovibrionota bacterium]
MFQFSRNDQDRAFAWVHFLNAFFSSLCVALIFVFLLKESISFLKIVNVQQLFSQSWYPLENQFNMLPMFVGSLLLGLLALFLAIPLAFFAAIFHVFYCPSFFKQVFRAIVELYTGIPSVIFGFWGLMNLVPFIAKFKAPGFSLLAGVLILALMIFPIICLSLIESLEIKKKSWQKVASSLAIRKETYLWKVLLPNLKSDFASSSLLALGRAIGETMAVLMVCGNIVQVPKSFFEPLRALTSNIALEMAYADGLHRSSLFFSGMILFLLVGILFFLSHKVVDYADKT